MSPNSYQVYSLLVRAWKSRSEVVLGRQEGQAAPASSVSTGTFAWLFHPCGDACIGCNPHNSVNCVLFSVGLLKFVLRSQARTWMPTSTHISSYKYLIATKRAKSAGEQAVDHCLGQPLCYLHRKESLKHWVFVPGIMKFVSCHGPSFKKIVP